MNCIVALMSRQESECSDCTYAQIFAHRIPKKRDPFPRVEEKLAME
jgi:hypothetical protein